MRGKLARIAAWVVTLGLLGFLFWRTPISDVADKARGAAGWTVPVAIVILACIYLADSLAVWKTFGWFAAKLSLREILIVRGATYLLAAISYSVGQGAIVYFVHRVGGVPIMRGVATVLFIMGINMLVLLVLASGGLLLADTDVAPPALLTIVFAAYAGLAVYALAMWIKPGWLARRPVFQVLLGAGLRGHLKATLVRLPHLVALVAYTTCMLAAFGIPVPIRQVIIDLPVVFFIAVLPISVQGLGTTQAAMIFFFARHAPGSRAEQEAAVLACSLVSQAISLGFQTTLGLACLRTRVARELRTATAAAASPTADQDPGQGDGKADADAQPLAKA